MRTSALAAGACSLLLAASLAAPAAAHSGHDTKVVTDDLVGPLSLALGERGDVYVAQTFKNTLSKVDHRGNIKDLRSLGDSEHRELTGVDYRNGSTYHLENTSNAETMNSVTSHVVRTDHKGKRTVVSKDLAAYERRHNPDRKSSYGFQDLRSSCRADVAKVEKALGGLPLNEYTGIQDSHAYQLRVHQGTIYVADAAGNTVLKVDERTGNISTVAVIPAAKVKVNAEHRAYLQDAVNDALKGMAEETGKPAPKVTVPECILGSEYRSEPVPTDVDRGNDGRLYVSTLGGGLGEAFPLSKVYRVSESSGHVRVVADGMLGATGLDVASNGTIYVAEMFGAEVSSVKPGSTRARTVLDDIGMVSDVEVDGRDLYATTVDLESGAGTLVKHHF
jgi:sugar lactone lactonase YvrE